MSAFSFEVLHAQRVPTAGIVAVGVRVLSGIVSPGARAVATIGGRRVAELLPHPLPPVHRGEQLILTGRVAAAGPLVPFDLVSYPRRRAGLVFAFNWCHRIAPDVTCIQRSNLTPVSPGTAEKERSTVPRA